MQCSILGFFFFFAPLVIDSYLFWVPDLGMQDNMCYEVLSIPRVLLKSAQSWPFPFTHCLLPTPNASWHLVGLLDNPLSRIPWGVLGPYTGVPHCPIIHPLLPSGFIGSHHVLRIMRNTEGLKTRITALAKTHKTRSYTVSIIVIL